MAVWADAGVIIDAGVDLPRNYLVFVANSPLRIAKVEYSIEVMPVISSRIGPSSTSYIVRLLCCGC